MSIITAAVDSRLVPYALNRRFRYSPNTSERAIQQMVRFQEATALPLMCVDASAGIVLATSDDEFVEILPPDVFAELADGPLPKIVADSCGLTFYSISLPDLDGMQTIGIGYVIQDVALAREYFVLHADDFGWTINDIIDWIEQQKTCSPDVLHWVLKAFCDREKQHVIDAEEEERQRQRTERSGEQLQFLHRMLALLAISQQGHALNDAGLAGLQQLTQCSGCALLWEQAPQRHLEVKHGHVPVALSRLRLLIDQCSENVPFDPVVRHRVAGTLLGSDFPGVQSLLINPIREGSRVTGWICLFNRATHTEFDEADIVLADTVATLIVTHARNREVYEAHDELLLQFVGSLVTTIDAKDSYTRGHSERVAAISRCVGKQMGLSEQDLHDCFNAGLLHDIGKIGVNDAILQKTDALNAEEYEHVKQHPMIGYRILRGLKSMHRLLPGIRNHHEDYSGNGYPDRLAGNEIPLLARILAVADAYDAMRSDRPYRKGMPQSQVDHIFRNGSGKQWDPDVISAYFAAYPEIRKIGDSTIWSDDDPAGMSC